MNVVFLTPADDVMMETVVEVSTECGPIEEESFPIPPDCEPAVKKKRGGLCHYSKPSVLKRHTDIIIHDQLLYIVPSEMLS